MRQVDPWPGLSINAAHEARRMERFLRRELRRLGKSKVVLGLSGGLDSSTCAYLCVRALGAEPVQALILPERDSHPDNMAHARLVAERLGIPVEERDITPLLRQVGIYDPVSESVAANRGWLEAGIRWLVRLTRRTSAYTWAMGMYYNQGPGLVGRWVRRFLPDLVGDAFTFALSKPRLRMVQLYHAAAQHNALLVGTLDRSEWAMGFYEPHGDGAADVQLLVHLYKTQIRALARYLGVPEEIVVKPSSGDLAAGLPNESLLGLSYEQLDAVLYGLDHGVPEGDIRARAGVSRQALRDIQQAMRIAELRRALPARLPAAGFGGW